MPNANFDEVVFAVAAETIGRLGLMFPVPPEEAGACGGNSDAADRPEQTVIAVTFTGCCGGMLILRAEGILAELAANMLGVGDGADVAEEQQHDALKELANVICGNLLPALAGSVPVFHIDAPRLITDGIVPEVRAACSGTARLWFESGSIELELALDKPLRVQGVSLSGQTALAK
jgi:CheY-specific phosphatase CheX